MRESFGSSTPRRSSAMEAGDATSSKSTPSTAGTARRKTPSSSSTARCRLAPPSRDAHPTTFGLLERGDMAASSSVGSWRLPRVRPQASSSPARTTKRRRPPDDLRPPQARGYGGGLEHGVMVTSSSARRSTGTSGARARPFFRRRWSLPRIPAAARCATDARLVSYTGEHLFTIFRHSRVKGSNTCLTSKRFRVGGYDWVIYYYPNGDSRIADGQFTSVYLMLMSACQREVKLCYSFCLQDPAAPLTGDKNKFGHTVKFSSEGDSSGTDKFVSKADLAASGCLKDDCLVIKCTVDVIDNGDDSSSIVPPSELREDLHNLLQRGFRADLTVVVGKYKTFKVHGCILAARSPVFQAQLCGSMAESTESSIHIDGMSAKAFEVLLYYMYNDCLPGFMDEPTKEATNMATHLLVAADRYAMERLKLMCECKLSKAVALNTVGAILNLAEQYSCHQLKARCLKYVGKNSERRQAIEDAGGFARLKHDHPLLALDILGQPGCKKNKKKKKKGGTARNK